MGGSRFKKGDENFQKFLSHVDKYVRGIDSFGAMTPIPAWLHRTFPSIAGLLGLNAQLIRPLQTYFEVKSFVIF